MLRARSRSDIAIGLALLAMLLANTVMTGTARVVLVYGAVATAVAVAVATKNVVLSIVLAAAGVVAVVLLTQL